MDRTEAVYSFCQETLDSIDKVVIGKRQQMTLILAAFLAQGHVLLEDIPGVGKTLAARTFASTLGYSFKRIQFTPDTLPGDVTGIYVFNQKEADFIWKPGPIFANVVLGDELNRATPRTQSSLLEAMEERQVTVEGVTHYLPQPFMVLATQNPIDMEGTFPLPEAQLDRFLISLDLGYLSPQEEAIMIERYVNQVPSEAPLNASVSAPMGPSISPPVTNSEIFSAISLVKMSQEIVSYVISIADATRTNQGIALGVSPRGSLYLARLAKAYALIQGRDFVLPDDIKAVAVPCLAHRIIPRSDSSLRGKTGKDLIAGILSQVPVPIESSRTPEALVSQRSPSSRKAQMKDGEGQA